MISLKRRGYELGKVIGTALPSTDDTAENWPLGKPVLLRNVCLSQLAAHQQDIHQSRLLYQAILDEQECDPIFAAAPYRERLDPNFESLGCMINEGDDQEIETIYFDSVQHGEVLAEDLWVKISWLSFYEADASLRFRFSFGMDHVEEVSADQHRQHYAALLTDAVFPESRLITENEELNRQLSEILGSEKLKYVERIVYFNSPEGGAYLHHDLERGHAGVVYAQVSGSTYWLALPKYQLMQEITRFIEKVDSAGIWPQTLNAGMRNELNMLVADCEQLSCELESFCNAALIHLINETAAFVQHLIANGHGRLVNSGDAILLPQESLENCCWHTVFSLGEETGQALSFAIRTG